MNEIAGQIFRRQSRKTSLTKTINAAADRSDPENARAVLEKRPDNVARKTVFSGVSRQRAVAETFQTDSCAKPQITRTNFEYLPHTVARSIITR